MPAALALSIDCDGCTVERLRRVFRSWAGGDATEFGPRFFAHGATMGIPSTTG